MENQAPKNKKGCLPLLLIGGLFFIILLYMAIPKVPVKTDNDKTEETITAPEVSKRPVENWTYRENVDEMDGTKIKFAQATSSNKLDFDFPYNGGSEGYLILRKTGKNKTEVLLNISKGQFASSYNYNKYLEMKFDDAKPITIFYNSADNGVSDCIFLDTDITNIVKKIKSAKKIKIKVDFYRHSGQVLNFDVSGLNW